MCHAGLYHSCEMLYLIGNLGCEAIHAMAHLSKGVRQNSQALVMLVPHVIELLVYVMMHVLFHLMQLAHGPAQGILAMRLRMRHSYGGWVSRACRLDKCEYVGVGVDMVVREGGRAGHCRQSVQHRCCDVWCRRSFHTIAVVW